MPRILRISERLGLAFFGLALPLLIVPSAEDAFRLPQLISLSIVAFLLGLSWSRALALGWPTGLGLAYFSLRLVSRWSSGFELEWLLEQCLYAFLYFWASAHLADAERRARLNASLLSGAALVSVYAIFQAYGHDLLHLGTPSLGFGPRPAATLGNPDFLGAYLAFLFPLALAPYLKRGRRAWLAVLIFFALILTQTRAAWLAAAFAAAALCWLLRPQAGLRMMLQRLAVLAALPLLLLLPHALPEGVKLRQRALDISMKSKDADSRFFMGRVAWNIVVAHPWLGAGDFTAAYLSEQGRMLNLPEHIGEEFRLTHDAHNDWLQLAAESGQIAPLLLALLFALALRRGDPPWRAVLITAALNAMLNFPFNVPACAAVAFMLLGGQVAEGDGGPWALPWPALLGAIALFFFGRQLQSSILLNRGTSYSLLKRGSEAKPHLMKAAELQPRDQRIWMRLGLDADQAGDLALATLSFQHAVEALPSLPEANANYGLVLAKQNRLDEGKDYSLRALSLNPRSTEALGNLGKIEYLQGDIDAAIATYERGLAIDPQWQQGRFNLNAIYTNTGRKPGRQALR